MTYQKERIETYNTSYLNKELATGTRPKKQNNTKQY